MPISRLVISILVAVAATLTATADTGKPIVQDDFEQQDSASLAAAGWTLQTQGSDIFSTMSNDAFYRFGGKTDAQPTATRAFNVKLTQGKLQVVIGTTTSAAGTRMRIMDGDIQLFELQLQSRNNLSVVAKTTSLYTEKTHPGLDVSVLGSKSKGYAGRLVATFLWNVQNDGSAGSFSYSLDQPGLDTPEKLSAASADNLKFSADGVPDRVVFENTIHDNNARDVLIYDLQVVDRQAK